MRIVVITSALVVSALALAGCSATPDDDGLTIVASTNVYGDLASIIGGEHVTVKSLIDSPNQDPHSYEASAQDRLAMSRADLVILNGGGYDTFMEDLLGAGGSDPLVIDAVKVSGIESEHTANHDTEHTHPFNEHVWYDLESMEDVIDAIASDLGTIDPANAAEYTQTGDELKSQVDEVGDRVRDLEPQYAGLLVATTEPVPLYLIEALGMFDGSPEAFTEAIEEGGDVPPAALDELLDLLGSGTIAMLAYNTQTASPETERVRQAAEDAGIPVVDFTELLPQGEHYPQWMAANVDAIENALTP